MKTNPINFANAERLVHAEAKRRKALFDRRSKRLLWFVAAGLILVFIFL
jgi:hypothetical protein